MKLAIACLVGSVLAGSLVLAAAQEMGDPKAGLNYAQYICAECHGIRDGQLQSPHQRAPSFQTVANAPGMTSTALRVWFQSPHPSMPNLVLTEEQGDDLIAYILSLRKR